ncbi:MAG: hypothetical protein AB8H47_21710 [Bacteroidia bacterium]
MNSKRIIFLGAFLFTLSLLPAQRLQQGLSIGLPNLVRIPYGKVSYNIKSSGSKWSDDVFQLVPGYMLTYHFDSDAKDQWFIKHTAYAAGHWRVYSRATIPWDFPEFFIRFGAGRTHYLPFAPSLQWQWEIGGYKGRMWRDVINLDGSARPNSGVDWREVLPYCNLSLQTTTFGERLTVGAGFDIMLHDNFVSLRDDLMLTTYASWSLQRREEMPKKKAEPLLESQAPVSLQFNSQQYFFFGPTEGRYDSRFRGISVEYWWRTHTNIGLGNRLGINYSYNAGRGVTSVEMGNQWLFEAEQNLYWRFHERSPILPYAGLGLVGGLVVEQDFERLVNLGFARRKIFRPYVRIGAKLYLPKDRIFFDISVTSFPTVQMGLGVRLGR